MIFGEVGDMERDDVRLREQFVERNVLRLRGFQSLRGEFVAHKNLHTEALRHTDNMGANMTGTDDADGFSQ